MGVHLPGLDKILNDVKEMNVGLTESLSEISLGLNLVVDRLDTLIRLVEEGNQINPNKETL